MEQKILFVNSNSALTTIYSGDNVVAKKKR